MKKNDDYAGELSRLTAQMQGLLQYDSPQGKKARELLNTLSREIEQIKGSLPLTPYEQVKLSRHAKRPTSLDLIPLVFDSFLELHGDRCFSDDAAIVAGIALLNDIPLTLIAQQKGRNLEENLKRNFGMAHPEGYRKAKRLMNSAERFGRPVITFIDTPGAYPGIQAEERGQAQAIAENLYLMSGLRVPIISVVIGEGGSGGALGIGVADRLIMLENAIYSVISPEGCAAILWKDAKKAEQAAQALRLTAAELLRLGIVDEIVREPEGGAHNDTRATARTLRASLLSNLVKLLAISPDSLLRDRELKYRRIGLS